MNYTLFVGIAVPILSGLTFVAYKHPNTYKMISNLILIFIAIQLFWKIIWDAARLYPGYGIWFLFGGFIIVYIWALRFLADVIEKFDGENRP